MEKVKNSAIEKTEKIANAPARKNSGNNTIKTGDNQTIRKDSGNKSKSAAAKNAAAREKAADKKRALKEQKKKDRIALKQQKKEEKASKKELKQKLNQNKNAAKLKRLEDKKKRRAAEFKKLEAERAERKKRLALAREERLKKRAERKALLKNETKKERKIRLEKERKLKLSERKKARAAKKAAIYEKQKAKAAALKAEKEARAAKKAERIRLKEEKRQAKLDKKGKVKKDKAKTATSRKGDKKGYGGWIAAVISLGCATLVLAGLLTFSIFEPSKTQSGYNDQNARGFYDLVGYVDNIDVNLSKFMASNDDGVRQKLLGDVRVQSNLAVENLSSLAIKDDSKYYTTKFINQTGDYAKYLGEKLMSGKPLTEKDMLTIESIYETNRYIKESLDELTGEIDENFDFSTIYEGKDDNVVIKRFKDLESKSVEYPHMVYDGAFADEIKSGNAESLKNEKEVSESEATDMLKKYFSNLTLSEVTLTGAINDEVLSGYNFTAVDSDGVQIDAQLSKKGGKLMNFNYYKECSALNYGLEACVKIADEFLKKAGLKNMKAVWILEDGANATVNYAYEQDGVICYSDLVKISVCRERGVVNGMDAKNYYLNHKVRELATPLIKLGEAQSRLNGSLTVQKSSLALIPQNGGSETLAYEFIADKEDGTYYVYIDALTGAEADIFKVVETSEGTMLM